MVLEFPVQGGGVIRGSIQATTQFSGTGLPTENPEAPTFLGLLEGVFQHTTRPELSRPGTVLDSLAASRLFGDPLIAFSTHTLVNRQATHVRPPAHFIAECSPLGLLNTP